MRRVGHALIDHPVVRFTQRGEVGAAICRLCCSLWLLCRVSAVEDCCVVGCVNHGPLQSTVEVALVVEKPEAKASPAEAHVHSQLCVRQLCVPRCLAMQQLPHPVVAEELSCRGRARVGESELELHH